jgi:TonB family protein
MFSSIENREKRSTATLGVSLAVHCAALVWILTPPRAIFISPSSVKSGVNGSSLSYLYFPARSGVDKDKEQASSTRKLVFPSTSKLKKSRAKLSPLPEPEEMKKNESAVAASPAGSVYGSSTIGSPIGQEVRPALRIAGSEPDVRPDDFAGLEGSIVIEITIDERGNIVEKNLLKSLAPDLDKKVLAALEDWRFQPATRDGVAIPSKEDVYYHFPVRR